MKISNCISRSSGTTRNLLALLAGAMASLSFSPIDLWWLGIIACTAFYCSLHHATAKQALRSGWCFGISLFGIGSSWIYVSISVYGNASPILAGLITGGFVLLLALYPALQAWLFVKLVKRFRVAGFAATWVLVEWLRSWLLTGFPWLLLGSAHVTTLFSGYAPVAGVFGVSFIIALTGAAFAEWCLRGGWSRQQSSRSTGPLSMAILCVLLSAVMLNKINWVQEIPGSAVSVATVQGNIAQDLKFQDDYLQQSLAVYERLSEPHWQSDVLLWPETAIPLRYQDAGNILEYFSTRAKQENSTLITGIFYDTGSAIHNSITALGNGEGIWHKQKLVPFGEYTPMRSLLSNLLQLFALPMSSVSPGPSDQQPLQAGQLLISPFICYEVVYPDFVRSQARGADFLITVSNDTWFGSSWGPLQHLQIATMRARELGRYMLRATNNGVSALIDERGNILVRSPQFEEATLSGTVRLFTGETPFSKWGSFPILLLCSLILVINFYPIGHKEETRPEAAE